MVKLSSYDLHFPMVIPRAALSNTSTAFRVGYYANNQSSGYGEVRVTTSEAKLLSATSAGTNVTALCETTIYYR